MEPIGGSLGNVWATAWTLPASTSRIWGNVGAFRIRTGFGHILYYNYNKEPPKPCSNYQGPTLPGFGFQCFRVWGFNFLIQGFKPVDCSSSCGTLYT